MMFENKVANARRQPVLLRQVNAIGDMADDDLRAGHWVKFVMWRGAVGNIFGKEVGADGFTDIVIIGPDAR